MQLFSDRSRQQMEINATLFKFVSQSIWGRKTEMGHNAIPSACDFVFGNPHEMPLPGFVDALQRWAAPQNEDWYAYKDTMPSAQHVVADSLRQSRGLDYDPADIYMTNGAFGGLAVALATLTNAGDEIIFNIPPWFFYDMLVVSVGGVSIRIKVRADNFDLDLDAIAAAITPRTKAVIVNSPNNPTGKIYPPETLTRLAEILTDASRRYGHPIFIISDEAYSKIIYEGRPFPSPANFYPYTFLVYTYGKTLLTPGQRVGYIAVPPTMPEREQFRNPMFLTQLASGYAFPNAILQHALADLEKLSIDIPHLQEKRDLLVRELSRAGYQVHAPEGTFYLMPRSPWDDDEAFIDLLGELNVFCLPGSVCEIPGYFRISLTANDEMIERALPRFAQAMEQAQQSSPAK